MALTIDGLIEKAGLACGRSLPALFAEVAALEGEAAKVRLVYERLLRPLPEGWLFRGGALAPEKSEAASAGLRAAGNDEFRRGRDESARSLYSRAAAAAPPGSEALRLALANRSAALFALGRRDACVLDVDRALDMEPPLRDPKLEDKLRKRRKACGLLPETPAPEGRPLFGPPAETRADVPCASAAVEIVHSPECGRSVVAARDVRVGETLALEEPHLIYVLEGFLGSRCYSCGESCDAMIPCDGCSRVMFCGWPCKAAAGETHQFECPVVAALIAMEFTKIERLGLLTALKARARHPTWERLRETVRQIEAVDDPLARGFVRSGDEKIYRSEDYAPIHALETNLDKRAGDNQTNKCFSAAAMAQLLKEHTSLFDGDREDANLWFFGGLIFHHIMTAASNMHSLQCLVEDASHNFLESDSFCSGAFPFLSLINHSCAPNVCRQSVGTKIVLLALRPIAKGQQLFDNYGQHHAMQPINERQSCLEFQYKFDCRCEACSDRWPLFFNLPNVDFKNVADKKFVNIIDSDVIEKLQKGDKEFALSILNKLYENVTMLEPHSPCREIAEHQETIKQCWALFGNVAYFK